MWFALKPGTLTPPPSLLSAFLWTGLVLLGYVTTIWLFSLWKKDASIMDIFWSLGFVLASLSYAFFLSQDGPRFWFAFLPVMLWGGRLALHIGIRAIGKPKDPRYQKWRREHGKIWWWRSFLQVFLLQGFLLWLISTPLLLLHKPSQAPIVGLVTLFGLALWTIGFVFESVADWQLTRFRADANNRGKVLNKGLWYYSRHPNYFGEAVLWWGFFVMALNTGGWWTFFSPVLMTWLLLKVSGVAMLDKLLVRTKPHYREYIETTNAFFPGPKKKSIAETPV